MKRSAIIMTLAASGLLHAQETAKPTITLTNDLLVQHNELAERQTPDALGAAVKRPSQYQESLSLFMNWGGWSSGITVRGVNFYKAESDITLDQKDVSLYRAYVKYSSNGFSAQLGDFNAVLGKGLVLSVVQTDALMQDWAVRGGDVRYLGNGFDARALAGTVTNNMRRLNDVYRKWEVIGAEAVVEFLPGNRVGIRGSRIDNAATPGRPIEEPLDRNRRVTTSASLAGSSILGLFDYYAEVAGMDYKDQSSDPYMVPSDTERDKGKAAYVNLAFHKGGLYMMAEYKNYKHFDNELNNPPLADRETEKVLKDNSSGQRLYTQYSFPDPDLTVFLSVGRVREGRLMGQRYYEGSNVYGGFKMEDLFDRVNTSFTYGLKTAHETGEYAEKKTDASLTVRLTPQWSLDWTFRDKRYREPLERPYDEWDITTQLARAPWGAVYVTHQYTSEANTPLNPFDSHKAWSGGLRVNLWKGSFIDISGGRIRGGEVCSGGQCRMLPAYKGWKVATSLRF